MNYLIYVSQARSAFTSDALAGLLAHSRERNAADGITGLLIYRYVAESQRGNFMQILEGAQAALDDVWDRIARDTRHHSVIVLEEGEAAARFFPDWTMGFRDVEQSMLAAFAGYADLGDDAFWDRVRRGPPRGALGMLQTFYEPA
ncbi:BLUF domain-containing protein [Sedimentitalea sp. XS_ASV28]|uniref:BLUF domain-containing protein n=1 Tax=Sedimentitalea sp. XS_ASV28 TaxID=3241296 RepID=UPI00351166D8